MLNIGSIIGKFIKNSSQRELDKLKSIVEKINALEPRIKTIKNEDFRGPGSFTPNRQS